MQSVYYLPVVLVADNSIRSFLWVLAYWGGEGGSNPPPPTETPKALQNRAKLNPNVKTVKNCWI